MNLHRHRVAKIQTHLVLWKFGIAAPANDSQVVRQAEHFDYTDARIEVWRSRSEWVSYEILGSISDNKETYLWKP